MSNSSKIAPVTGDFQAAAALEVDAGEAAAVALTIDAGSFGTTGVADFTYSATAEDNGTAGELDGQPGLVATGIPAGITVPVRVKVTNLDLAEGTISPAATDFVQGIVAVNSDRVGGSDEGFLEADATAEHNLDHVVYVKNNDVIRIAVAASLASADALDISVAEGGELTVF